MSPAPRRRGAAEAGAPPAPAEPALVLTFPSETAFLGLVSDVTRSVASLHFEVAVAERVALAVVEAATNVLEHAYGGVPGHPVQLRFRVEGGEFRVEVCDRGVRLRAPRRSELDLEQHASERRTGGLGIHLMERIMDGVSYRRDGRFNVCCLVKRKLPAAQGA